MFSVGIWIVAFSRVPVSIAYPMLSMGYIVNAIAAYFCLARRLEHKKYWKYASLRLV